MAARYWVNGGTGNWNSTTNWSATSGGASGATVPGTSDDVTFDAAGDSNSLMNTGGGFVINSLTVTAGYTSTLTLTTGTVNINGNCSLGSAMTLTGTGGIRVGYVTNTSVTLNTNGTTIGCDLTIGHASGSLGVTVTLQENVLVTGTFTFGQGSNTGDVIINSFNIECQGDVTNNGASSTRVSRGTTTLSITGSANQQLSGTGLFRNDVTINKGGGTLTITSFIYNTGTFTWAAGTVVHSGTLSIPSLGTTFNTSTGITWNNITCSLSVPTLTFSSTFLVSGNFSMSGAGTLTISGATFFTAVGGTLTLASNGSVFVPANDMTVGSLVCSTGTATINTYNVNITGSLTMTGGLDGSGSITLTGTGTWSGNGVININFVINTAGTITISGSVSLGSSGSAKSFTYTAGTIVDSGSTLTLRTFTMNSNSMLWNNVTITTSATITLTGDLNVTGLLTISNSSTVLNTSTSKKVYAASITFGTTATITGTSSIEVNNTGTITGAMTIGYVGIPFIINTSGTVTFTGTLHFQGSTFTYTQGTIDPDASTVVFSGTMNINDSGLSFNILDLDGNSTHTSTGTYGWTTNTLQSTSGTHNYKSGVTYTINNLLQLVGTAAARIIMLASTGGSQAYFNLAPAATQTNGYVTTTDINSAAGQTIFDWQGVFTNTVNWNLLVAPVTTAYTFFV